MVVKLFNKYLCKKYHAKNITVRMLNDTYGNKVCIFLLPVLGFLLYVEYLSFGLGTVLANIAFGICIIIISGYSGIYSKVDNIIVARCPLKKDEEQ